MSEDDTQTIKQQYGESPRSGIFKNPNNYGATNDGAAKVNGTSSATAMTRTHTGGGGGRQHSRTLSNGSDWTTGTGTGSSSRTLIKTRSESFYRDARDFAPGSLPHSMVLAAVIGVVCGTAAWIYYACLEFLLEFIWRTLPAKVFALSDPESGGEGIVERGDDHWYHALWIPLVGFVMALLLGLTVVFVGDPGDLPYTIKCVHTKAYVGMDHVIPMVVASQFSILGGGSLGPEAPLVAICAALGGEFSLVLNNQRALTPFLRQLA